MDTVTTRFKFEPHHILSLFASAMIHFEWWWSGIDLRLMIIITTFIFEYPGILYQTGKLSNIRSKSYWLLFKICFVLSRIHYVYWFYYAIQSMSRLTSGICTLIVSTFYIWIIYYTIHNKASSVVKQRD